MENHLKQILELENEQKKLENEIKNKFKKQIDELNGKQKEMEKSLQQMNEM